MTVATNALLEGRGAPTALIATEGFTDLVALGRQDRAEFYRLCAARPAPLVARRAALRRPRADDPRRPAARARRATPPARSPHGSPRPSPRRSRWRCCTPTATPSTSRRSARRWREALPDVHVSLSHEVVGTFREFERAATTEVDAALSPLLASYLRRLLERCGERGPARARDHAVKRRPDRRRGGGRPRGLDGPLRARRGRRRGGLRRPRGRRGRRAVLRHGRDVVRRVRRRRRRRPGAQSGEIAGRPLALPMLAVHTVGAGGGSIAWRDAGGALRVGPRSAGAEPGPGVLRARRHRADRDRREPASSATSSDAPLAGGVELDRGRGRRRSARWPTQLASTLGACAEGIRPRRQRRDDPGAAGRHRPARHRPAPLRADGLRRRRPAARRRRSPTSSGSTRSSARAPRASSRRSGWSSRRAGATCSAACFLSGDGLDRGGDRGARRRRSASRPARRCGEPEAELHVVYELRYRGQSFELPIAGSPTPDPRAAGRVRSRARGALWLPRRRAGARAGHDPRHRHRGRRDVELGRRRRRARRGTPPARP